MDSLAVPLLVLLATAVVLIVLSTVFSATESAFFSVNKLRVRLLRGKQDKRAIRVWNLLKNKDRLINTLLVGNNIVNIALSAVFTFIAVGLFGSAGIGLATFVVTILLLVFGEITPKIIATHHPEAVAFFFSFFVQIIETLLFPLVMIFTSFSRIRQEDSSNVSDILSNASEAWIRYDACWAKIGRVYWRLPKNSFKNFISTYNCHIHRNFKYSEKMQPISSK